MSKNDIARLFLDVETCPNIVLSWRAGYNITITPDNILEERRIICASWKWQGEKKVHNASWDKDQCDKKVLEKVIQAINKADEIVYQNGDRFDLPWIKTRALFHGIPMLPTYKTFDTLKKIKSNFYFNSNRLDYVQKFLGGQGKLDTGGYKLWTDVHMKDDRKALKKMVSYCDQDVVELEHLFRKILPYVPHNTHVGALLGEPKYTCPNCGSADVCHHQKRVTAAGTIKHGMKCKTCSSHYTISNADYNRLIKDRG